MAILASDGQSLFSQSPETVSAFLAAYGADAERAWAARHDYDLYVAAGSPGKTVQYAPGYTGQVPAPAATASPDATATAAAQAAAAAAQATKDEASQNLDTITGTLQKHWVKIAIAGGLIYAFRAQILR